MYLYIGGSQVYLVLYIRPGLLLYSEEAGMRLKRWSNDVRMAGTVVIGKADSLDTLFSLGPTSV